MFSLLTRRWIRRFIARLPLTRVLLRRNQTAEEGSMWPDFSILQWRRGGRDHFTHYLYVYFMKTITTKIHAEKLLFYIKPRKYPVIRVVATFWNVTLELEWSILAEDFISHDTKGTAVEVVVIFVLLWQTVVSVSDSVQSYTYCTCDFYWPNPTITQF